MVIVIAFVNRQYGNYINIVNTIDIGNWEDKTYDFINKTCNCCKNKPMVYPTNSIRRISDGGYREDLIHKLDSGNFFRKKYETLNLAEKYSIGLGYTAFIWLDDKEPIYRYSYSIDASYQIDKVDFSDFNQNLYKDFFSKSQIEKPYCDPDTTMDVLRGSFFYTKFSIKDEKLEPEIREVLLY